MSFVITFIHHLSPFTKEYHKALYLVPHFFFIYINDIVNASSNLQFIVYADDTTVVLKDKNINSLHANLISELENISSGIHSNKLKLNVSKTNCILFQNRSLNSVLPPVFLNNELIQQVKYTKFLGVVIDEHLNWKHNIDQT